MIAARRGERPVLWERETERLGSLRGNDEKAANVAEVAPVETEK